MRIRFQSWTLAPLCAAALGGCMSAETIHVRDAARPDAAAALADAPSLLPALPMASTTTTRSQAPDVVPASSGRPGPSNAVAIRMRASVNGAPIMEDELREALGQYAVELMQAPEAQRAEAIQRITERELNRLIDRELILDEAFSKLKALNKPQILEELKREAAKEGDKRVRELKAAIKITNDDEFKAALRSQGMSVEGLRRQAERNFMMMEYVRNLIFPMVNKISLNQVREYYQAHPQEFTTEDSVSWQGLFIDASKHADSGAARRHADQVLAKVRAGVDFAQLAQQFDDGDSKLRGGAGIGNKRGAIMPQQAEELVWSLKAGESGLLDLGFGYHIVRVATRDYAGLRQFDVACQTEIRNKLKNMIAEREYKRVVDDLKRKATITIY